VWASKPKLTYSAESHIPDALFAYAELSDMARGVPQKSHAPERRAEAISISWCQRDGGIGAAVNDETILVERDMERHFGLVARVFASHRFEFSRGWSPTLDLFVSVALVDRSAHAKAFAGRVELSPRTILTKSEYVARDWR